MKNCSVQYIRYVRFLIAIGILASSNFARGQNYWKPAGNSFSSTGGVKKLGTMDCNEIDFMVNGINRIKFTSNCISSENNIEFTNNDNIDFSSTELLYLPGGGTIYTKGSSTSLLPGSIATGMKIGLTDSVQQSNATFQLFDSPAAFNPLIHAETKSTGNTNCYSIFAKAFPKGGYGYGISAEGGRYGIYAKANGNTFASGTVVVSGIYAKTTGTEGLRSGVLAESAGTLNSTNFGIYALASSINGGSAGYFSGDITYTGALYQGSDRKLKKNISDCKNALEIINKLSVKEYYYDEKYSFMNFPATKQIGLIAQDVEEIIPELVDEKIHPGKSDEITGEEIHEPVTYKAINYTGLIPVVIGAMHEQQEELMRLKEINEQLQRRLTELEGLLIPGIKPQTLSDHTSSNKKKVSSDYLLQNTPNPAIEETDLPFNIDADFNSAEIRIISATGGHILQRIPVVSKGYNKVRLDCSLLHPGVYIYELIIDGVNADSRNLIIAE